MGETSGESSTQGQTNDGSSTGTCPVGAEGCPCTGGGVCDPGLVCSPMMTCVDAGGTTTEEPNTSTTADTTSTTGVPDTSTGEQGQCDPGLGQPNFDCMNINPDEPYCAEAEVCGGCSVLPPDGCSKLPGGKPICDPESGQCVECTTDDDSLCGGDKPACNPDSGACEGCFQHSHCPDSACDLIARKCFPVDRVLHIRLGLPGDPNNVCTDKVPTGGSETNPYCFAESAIQHAQWEGLSSGWTFKFMKTNWDQFYHPVIVIPGDGTDVRYAFIHEPAAYIGDRHMSIRDIAFFNAGIGITAYIDNFYMEAMDPPSDLPGVICQQGGRLFLDDSYVRGARGPGVKSIGCEVWVRNTTVTKGWTEGIDVVDGKLHLINSYVTENSFYKDKRGGGIAATNSALDIVYSSILNNNNELGLGGDSIDCRDGQVVGVIRNSVIGRKSMGTNASIKCDPINISVVDSVHDSDEFKGDNLKLAGETILGWFEGDLQTGAYKIIPPTPNIPGGYEKLKNAGIWRKGDPRVDYDGDPRHTKDGEPDFAGADVLIVMP